MSLPKPENEHLVRTNDLKLAALLVVGLTVLLSSLLRAPEQASDAKKAAPLQPAAQSGLSGTSRP